MSKFTMPESELEGVGRGHIHSPVDSGFIVTRANDTIRGFIKLICYHYGNTIPLIPFNESWNIHIIQTDRSYIRIIRSFNDSVGSKFTDYVNIGYKGLWRSLGAKNNVGLYDNYGFMGNIQNTQKRIIFITYGDILKLYSGIRALFQKRPAFLRGFINRRYHQHFAKDYFKDEKAEVDYILNAESEKNKTK